MSHNSFGHLFRVTTWGESHGPALGCVVDGCPPGLPLTEADIQVWLEKRRPGPGQVRHLPPGAGHGRGSSSGVFEDERTGGPVTTGTPISLMIDNVDQRSHEATPRSPPASRPGHADYAYFARSMACATTAAAAGQSARETAARVAAGAICAARSWATASSPCAPRWSQIGPHAVDPARWDWEQVGENPFWCPDAAMVEVWESHLEKIRKAGSSTGAIVSVEAAGRAGRLGRADLR